MAVTPQDVLPDHVESTTLGGWEVRKGSVAAFVANAKALEGLPAGPARDDTVAALRDLAPALEAVGVFDVFALRSDAVRAALDCNNASS
jgi:hypothetical protein